MDENNNQIIDAQVVDDKTSTLLTITNLIQNYLQQINENKRLLTEHRQMIDDALNNDPVYKEHTEKAKEAAKLKNSTKKQLMQMQNMRELSEKVKDLSVDLKAARESLSQYLQQYKDLTGSNQFEDGKGEVLDIVYSAKLVRASTR